MPPTQNPPPEQASRGDHADVEQIMREIRSRIAQRHGVDLTEQQVQELAARRLESILDPRTIKPSLLEQLRRSAGARPDTVAAADRASAPYEFEDTTLYDSPHAFTRFVRKLLNPILKLFFNPNPLIRALHVQAQVNAEARKREAERDQRQAEWNALHYEILQRLVAETAKVSLELQGLSLKTESLSGKVDFNERRVRGIEGIVHQPRPGGGRERERERDVIPPAPPPPVIVSETAAAPAAGPAAAAEQPSTGEAPRRRRRRRRGRRGGGPAEMPAAAIATAAAGSVSGDAIEDDEVDEGDVDALEPVDLVTTGTEAIEQTDAVTPAPAAVPEPAPERVTPQLSAGDPVAREEAAPEIPAPAAAPGEEERDESQ